MNIDISSSVTVCYRIHANDICIHVQHPTHGNLEKMTYILILKKQKVAIILETNKGFTYNPLTLS